MAMNVDETKHIVFDPIVQGHILSCFFLPI